VFGYGNFNVAEAFFGGALFYRFVGGAASIQKRDAVRPKPRYDVSIVFDLDFVK
jgi:hypothetical protein